MTTIYRTGEVWMKNGRPREIVRIVGMDLTLHESTEGLPSYLMQWRRCDPGQIRHNLGEMWERWAAGAECTRRVPA